MTIMGVHIQDPWTIGGILVLLGALALSLAGMGMLIYSARMTREAVSKRLGLIQQIAVRVRTLPITSTLVRSGLGIAKERERREAAIWMARFGVPAERAGATLIWVRLASVAILALLAFIGASHWSLTSKSPMIPVLVAMVAGILGWFLPMILVGRQATRRTKSIVKALPDALELLVICVQAGLSFEDGIDRVAGVLVKSEPALSEELSLTSADMKILPSRDQALVNLAARVDTPSVRSVVTTLSQTLRYGTPLVQALRVVSGELRNDSLVRMEERANQLPTLMTIPMMLFIMPTIFMIVGGPAALKVLDSLKH